jgi:hypothetical protein
MLSPQNDMAERVSFLIFGAAVTTTRAFDKVSIKIDSNNNRIFVAIRLKWFLSFKKFEKLHHIWLSRAEKRCKEVAPEGWNLLCYYEKDGET